VRLLGLANPIGPPVLEGLAALVVRAVQGNLVRLLAPEALDARDDRDNLAVRVVPLVREGPEGLGAVDNSSSIIIFYIRGNFLDVVLIFQNYSCLMQLLLVVDI